MKSRGFRSIWTIYFSALLVFSLFVIVMRSAEAAEPAPVDTDSNSLGSNQVSAASGTNRFVVWTDTTPGNDEIFFRRSTDSGATWKSIVNLSNNLGDSQGARIAVSGSNVYVSWVQYDSEGQLPHIFFRHSADNGITWESKVMISNSGHATNFPQIAVSSSDVYVVWTDDSGGKDDIMLRRSADNGDTWKSAVNVSNNPGRSYEPVIALSGAGVYLVWTQANADQTSYDILFRRSTVNGDTWEAIKNLSNTRQAVSPQIAVSGSKQYIVWTDGPPDEAQDIMFRRSTDNGATWKAVMNLSDDPSSSVGPLIAVSGSDVYVTWSDDPADTNVNNVLFRRCTDSGVTWKPVKDINPNGGGFPRELAASGSKVYVVMQDAEILFRLSNDNGATWNAIKDLSNNVGDSIEPQLALSGSSL